MKKFLSVFLVVFAITAIFASSVLAAPANSTVNLVSVSYNDGGVVLIFETSGLTKSDLKDATILIDSNWHKMYCTFVDNTTKVRCTVSKKMAGKGEFYAVLAGVGFWGELPNPRPVCGDKIPWYSFNQYQNGTLVGSGELPVWFWEFLVENGIIAQFAKAGTTFELTGTFCGPNNLSIT